jgi:hypothetical protein
MRTFYEGRYWFATLDLIQGLRVRESSEEARNHL